MDKKFFSRQAVLLWFALFLIMQTGCKMEPTPPDAEKKPHEITTHGDTRVDNYYWMRDRENPKVIEYLEAENEYADAMMAHTEDLQEKLFDEIVGRIKETDESVPYFDNGYYYYTRYEEGKEFPIYCRREGSMDAEEEILLDVNEKAEGYDFYQATGLSVSPDNKMLAFGADTVGRRRYTIHFKDLTTGEILDESIPVTTGGSVWGNDSETLFYTTRDYNTLRADKIHRHKVGDDPDDSELVYYEEDNTFRVGVSRTKSREYIMIVSSHTLSTEYRYLDADNPGGEFTLFQPRERDMRYSVDHHGDNFYIVTNMDAPNFRLMKTPVNRTGKENWQDVIPHRDDVLLSGIEIFTDHLVVSERKDGLTQLRVMEWDGDEDYYLEFEEEAYTVRTSRNPDIDTDVLRFSYTSLTTPSSIYDYNMNTGERELLRQDEVLGDFEPDDYEARRYFATADDGTEVPISLVFRKGTELDGNNPLLLDGYGSYGSSRDPSFSSVRLSLLDRGFVYAIAHIRGGQEMGRHWYDEGKLLNKKNTFTDFIACTEFLIENNYTNPDLMFAQGGSAGGLLIGAVINMRPDLYRGVISRVPFVDIVTTMLDESIPLTTFEYDEWGNPNDPEYYEYMLSYSPYDNVEEKDYPAMFVTSGLHDSQVQFWEPTKWVAKLRDKKTDDNPLLLRTNMEAGHGGAAGRYQRYRETAELYAFLLDLAGISE